ncbi:MAG: O-antigen ligase family protein [Verrucomicrobiota bacterium]|jgi:O-antigen ligase|nr:O-antigen ligase family protein [Verrucomicrobiota bacterium]
MSVHPSWGKWAEIDARSVFWHRLYDGIALILLAWPALGGMWLLGSTRVWGYSIGLFLSFLGALLIFARPLVIPSTPRWRVPNGLFLYGILCVYLLWRMTDSPVPSAARWDALKWICLGCALFSWIQVGNHPFRWRWLLGLLLLGVAFECLYAIIQNVNGERMVLWVPRPEQYGIRASGTYLCPNHLANAIAMLLPVALVLLLLPDAGFPLRIMAVYYLLVSMPVLYWTQSRSGWLGMVGGVCLTLWLLAWRKSRRLFWVSLLALPLLMAVLGAVAWKMLPAVRERVGAVCENPEASGGIRVPMWRDMPDMIRDKPVFGHGGGSFVWTYPPYQRHVRQHLTWDYLHNEYLQLQVEYGAVGSALAAGVYFLFAWQLLRGVLRARSRPPAFLLAGAAGSLFATLLHAIFDFNFHIFPNPHMLMWIGGIALGVWYFQEGAGMETTGSWKQARWGVAALAVVGCAWAAWFSLAGGMSYAWTIRGELAREAFAAKDSAVEEATAAYQKAIAWDSWNWEPALGLAILKTTQAFWYRDPDLDEEKAHQQMLIGEAVEHYHMARERNPYDMAIEFGLARAMNVLGNFEEALLHYQRAAEYQQRHVFYREQLGIQLRRMGRDQEALDVFRRNVQDKVHTDVSVLNIRALERKADRQAKAPAAIP